MAGWRDCREAAGCLRPSHEHWCVTGLDSLLFHINDHDREHTLSNVAGNVLIPRITASHTSFSLVFSKF